jgi:glycosyltransferase involved in cell wall biosynthesis
MNADLLEQRKFKGVPERGVRRWFAEWATRLCLNTATRVICISSGLRDHLRRRWGVPDWKLSVVPCAADVEAFTPNGRAARARHELGVATEPVVMWIGGFYPWHDLGLLLESFSHVLPRHPDAKLILVGDGPTRPTVARAIATAGLDHAVMMTGAVAHTRMPEMLSIADITVAPAAPVSASGGGTGTPLKLFEYMAAGKAIIATAVDQTAEVIRDGETGLLTPAGDAPALARALLTLLGDPAERDRLGTNARRRALAQHSWEHYTRSLEAIYVDARRDAHPER